MSISKRYMPDVMIHVNNVACIMCKVLSYLISNPYINPMVPINQEIEIQKVKKLFRII